SRHRVRKGMERRLPNAEYLVSSQGGERTPSRDGVDPRRRILWRRQLRPADRWSRTGAEGRGAGQLQLPTWRLRLLLASVVVEGIAAQCVRQLWPVGPGRRL